jgi:hypothetical protein
MLSGTSYFSISRTDYSYPIDYALSPVNVREGSSMDSYGFGFGVSRTINRIFSASGNYDFSLMDKGTGSYNRHLINALITGRF